MKIEILNNTTLQLAGNLRVGYCLNGISISGTGHKLWRDKTDGSLFITDKDPSGEFSEDYELVCTVPDHHPKIVVKTDLPRFWKR